MDVVRDIMLVVVGVAEEDAGDKEEGGGGTKETNYRLWRHLKRATDRKTHKIPSRTHQKPSCILI